MLSAVVHGGVTSPHPLWTSAESFRSDLPNGDLAFNSSSSIHFGP